MTTITSSSATTGIARPTAPVRRRAGGAVRPADTRRHHRALVLQALVDLGPTSRADLARHTGLTRVTISDLVGDLLEAGLVSDAGQRPGVRVGKPATLVALAEDGPVVVAIDLSTEAGFAGALVDLHGNVLERRSCAPATGGDALDAVADLAHTLVQLSTRPVLGIGVGTPGIVSPEGRVLQAPNLDWDDVDLPATLSARTGLAVSVGNDANLAAMAECSFGAADDAGVLMITIGRGVGGGIVMDGVQITGPLLSAGEIGHVVVDPDGAPCACGNAGCLETFLAAPVLRASTDPQVRRHAGRLLGSVLTPVVTTLGLTEVILHGPTELLEGPLVDAARETLANQSLPFVARSIRIRLLAHDHLVLSGAAALVRFRELGVV